MPNQKVTKVAKSFLDALVSKDHYNNSVQRNHDITSNILSREDKNIEVKMLTRKIANNTDTIIDVLKDIQIDLKGINGGGGGNVGGLSSLLGGLGGKGGKGGLLPYLAPLLAGAIAPEMTKYVTDATKAVGFGTDMAKMSGHIGDASKLAKLGSNNPMLRKVGLLGSGGAIVGRYAQGDGVGAGMEATSLALSEASRVTTNPRLKIGLMASSFATDGAIMVRDAFRKKDNSDDVPTLTQSPDNKQSNVSGILAGTALATGTMVGGAKLASTMGNSGGALAKTATVGGAKMAGKMIPFLGGALGAYGAYSRAKDGDYYGAGMEALSGVASFVPGAGTAVAGSIQVGLLARDLKNSSEKATDAISKSSVEVNKSIKSTNENVGDFTKSMDQFKDTSTDLLKSSFNIFNATKNLSNANLQNITSNGSNIVNTSTTPNAFTNRKSVPYSYESITANNNDLVTKTTSPYKFGRNKTNSNSTATDLLMSGESGGNYDIANKFKTKGVYTPINANASNMTIGQVQNSQASKQMFAVGAYQIVPTTLQSAVKSLGLSANQKFDKSTQDKIYQDFLIKRARPPIYDYITAKSNDLTKAILYASMEWAAIGVPYDINVKGRLIKKGDSYHSGKGGNKASIDPDEYGRKLQAQRARYLELRKQGLSEEDAYHKSFESNGNVSDNSTANDSKITPSADVQGVTNASSTSADNTPTSVSSVPVEANMDTLSFKANKDTSSLLAPGMQMDSNPQVAQTIKRHREGGGINEDTLFNPNLGRQNNYDNGQMQSSGKIYADRQQDFDNGQMQNAGKIFNGRQNNYDNGQMQNSGRILNGRQNNYDRGQMQNAGSGGVGKQRLKGLGKVFNSEKSGLYSSLANLFGLGDLYNLGQGAYGADQSGRLLSYGLGQVGNYIGGDFGKALGIGATASDLYNGKASVGQWGDFGIGVGKSTGLFGTVGITDGMADIVNGGIQAQQNGGSIGLAEYGVRQASKYSPLSPDYQGKKSIDSHVSTVNQQYEQNKNNPIVMPTPSTTPPPSKMGNRSTSSSTNGMASSIVTRNPDSIFRAVALSNMKATLS